jgi:hypothetical protein
MILPARTKWVGKGRALHFFCPGAGCGERLAILATYSFTEKGTLVDPPQTKVRLEPGYTNGPHPSYPAGRWWRQKEGVYKGMLRARDVRKLERDDDPVIGAKGAIPGTPFGKMKTAFYRGKNRQAMQPMPTLPPGTHIVVCYRCGGEASIEAPGDLPPGA